MSFILNKTKEKELSERKNMNNEEEPSENEWYMNCTTKRAEVSAQRTLILEKAMVLAMVLDKH